MRNRNSSLVSTYYYFSLGKAERPTTVPIKAGNLGKALECVRPELLNHIYTLTIHRYSHSTTRADNMYVGQIHDIEHLKHDNPQSYDLLYSKALQRVDGDRSLLTDKYCHCANGERVVLKENEKVYDNEWQCVWPHHERGSLLYENAVDFQEETNFKLGGIPERLYEFIISQPDGKTQKRKCFFHNFYSIVNPETDYAETLLIKYLEGLWNSETNLFRTRTNNEKFLALGKRVTTLDALQQENSTLYKDLVIARENNKEEIMAQGTPYIVERYNGIYAFLPKDTAVMDNSFNIIFPSDEVKKDKRFKVHHLKALKKTNAMTITELNKDFWKNRPYCTSPLFNF